MSYYNHQQAPVVYPPPPAAQVYPPPQPPQAQPYYPPPVQGPYVVPPPVVYPMKAGAGAPHQRPQPEETKRRGSGFCRGW
ncbi:Detected protein of unknown function [Hibiscus syriacus]|uniref:Uncharacterized protein n=1 Tax=Hibiscus syriacus TaxID=106335 RepID=A0A6A2XTJ8_HIBSY|nr:Detected protein of unknown function [Hibiscus syriacus]